MSKISKWAFWALILGAIFRPAVTVADQRPNILIILADDLGYADVGFHGGKEIPTPHLDLLASEGVRLTSGYVSGPYCSPTRAGLLTGKYQERFGHEFNPGPNPVHEFGLSLSEKTIADRLKQAGYATALIGKWHLGTAEKFHPQQRGFDEFFGFLGGAHPYFPDTPRAAPIFRGTEVVKEEEYLTDAFTREALSYLDRPREEPFFLYLAYNAVHNPQQAKPEHLQKFAHIKDERRRTYAGLLTALDEGVGKVLAKLKEKQLDQNTLVVFLSDNGGPPANGSTNTPLRGQKATTWEGGVRVPFVIRWTGHLPAGTTYDHPVIQLDLLPTALALAGAPAPPSEGLDGVNLLPYLKQEVKEQPHEFLYWRFGAQTAIRSGDWKLVQGTGTDSPILINLREDIAEEHDLSAKEPEKVKALQAAWDAWNQQLVKPTWVPQGQNGPARGNAKRNNAANAAPKGKKANQAGQQ